MKKLTVLILALLLLLTACAPPMTPWENPDAWVGGYAEQELIAEDPTTQLYYVAGYKNDNPATGILDNQMVKAAYLEAGGEAVLWIAVDCVGLSSKQAEAIKKEADLPRNIEIHVVSTHTHAGIDTFGLWGPVAIDGKDQAFSEQLTRKAGETARAAYESRREGKLLYGSTQKGIEDLQNDSRDPQIYDKNLYQLRFEPTEGKGFRIFDYAAHAEALREKNTLISADYPAYLCRAIKRETGEDAMYVPGAIGGLIMTRRLTNEKGSKLPVTENVVATGELLAKAALSISNERELSPVLTQATKEITLPLDNQLFVAMGALGILTNQIVSSGDGEYGLSVQTQVSVTRLGDLYMVSIPGELFPELAYGTGQQNGVEATVAELIKEDFILVGLCDDEIGYIVPPSDFLLDEENPYLSGTVDAKGEDHYEETNSLGPETAELLLEAIAELYESLQKSGA